MITRSKLLPHCTLPSLAIAILIGTTPVDGAIFTNRSDFLSAITQSVAVEGFESESPGTDFGLAIRSFSLFDAAYTGMLQFGVSQPPIAVEGVNALHVNFGGQPTLTLSFAAPVTTFGFDIIDNELFPISYAVSYASGGTTQGTAAVVGADLNVQFFGIIESAPIASIVFSKQPISGNETVWFDRVVVSQSGAVPEPASLTLWSLGALGLAMVHRRRRISANSALF